jgi:hypothetical protein
MRSVNGGGLAHCCYGDVCETLVGFLPNVACNESVIVGFVSLKILAIGRPWKGDRLSELGSETPR